MRQTRTYATMAVSPRVYDEVKRKLIDADYDHAIHPHGVGECLDMNGIALVADAPTQRFFIDQDDDAHWYLVPAELRDVWNAWRALDPEDEAAWEPPEGVKSLNGPPHFTFENPEFL